MRNMLIMSLVICLTATGCATVRDSRLNPFNWFGRAEPAEPVVADEENPLIPQLGLIARSRLAARNVDRTTPVTRVTELRIDRVPGGAIIRASGVDPVQGAFDVELVPEFEDEVAVDGVLTYTLERQMGPGRAGGNAAARTITAAHQVTDQTLRGVRVIRVSGVDNALTSRR